MQDSAYSSIYSSGGLSDNLEFGRERGEIRNKVFWDGKGVRVGCGRRRRDIQEEEKWWEK